VLDAGLEGDVLAQPEMVDVVVEVLLDVRVVREVGIRGRHREVGIGHPLARDVDEQVPVRRRHPVAVAEHPVAPDLIGLLDAVERDPAVEQRLGGRDARGAGADDAGTRRSAPDAIAVARNHASIVGRAGHAASLAFT
jgi:hypothetical protein